MYSIFKWIENQGFVPMTNKDKKIYVFESKEDACNVSKEHGGLVLPNDIAYRFGFKELKPVA